MEIKSAVPIRIPVPFTDLKCVKYVQKESYFLELYPDYILYRRISTAQSPRDCEAEYLVWGEPYQENLSWCIKRDNLISVETKLTPSGNWMVGMEIAGSHDDMYVHFRSEAKARELAAVLLDYLLGNTVFS